MTHELFDRILVANRGEIAVRIMRTLQRLGIHTIGVYSHVDHNSAHVHQADQSYCLGGASPATSYGCIDALIAAARATCAQAIHPGYGFCSENPAFAQACQDAQIVFLGPSPHVIAMMGDKIRAKEHVRSLGIPTIPGTPPEHFDDETLIAYADSVGYPLLIKPAAGGGGKGMHRVDDPCQFASLLAQARREASSAFGDETLLVERFFPHSRHVEIQILADHHGHVVHLGERECSVQRRCQKILEEAPSPMVSHSLRERMGHAACQIARSIGYVGVGTVEFLLCPHTDEEFFFVEMNTRLQVEHPISEQITGIDLVEWQVRIGAGQPLGFTQDEIHFHGHAIEVRLYAEDPSRGFLPTGGTVLAIEHPEHPQIRIDSFLRPETTITSHYDPMLEKIIVHGSDRAQTRQLLSWVLDHTMIAGVRTNLDFLRHLLASDHFQRAEITTDFLDSHYEIFLKNTIDEHLLSALALYEYHCLTHRRDSLWSTQCGWRLGQHAPVKMSFSSLHQDYHMRVGTEKSTLWVQINDAAPCPVAYQQEASSFIVQVKAITHRYRFVRHHHDIWVHGPSGTWLFTQHRSAQAGQHGNDQSSNDIIAPMPGNIIALHTHCGDHVHQGQLVGMIEAMKMEYRLLAPVTGTIEVLVNVGDQVSLGQVVARCSVDIHPS